jgi:1-acyl-sn-glycerol-3-phosphate acyltransferase
MNDSGRDRESGHKQGLLRVILRVYEPIAMVIGLGSLALICLAWWPAALALGALPLSATRRRRIGRRTIFFGARCYLWILRNLCVARIDASALRQLRSEPRLILVANHPSLLDAIIFLSHLPNAVCVMKLRCGTDNPMYGATTRLAHYVSNLSGVAMVHDASAELAREEGAHLVIFPEGTRTSREPINPCSRASALIATRAGVPVQTVFIDMDTPYLGKQWPLFKPPVLPLRCCYRLGPRYAPQADVLGLTACIERDLAGRDDSGAMRTNFRLESIPSPTGSD